jgi:hypothetical protein
MHRLTLLVLVDAFRHDYVERTRYIRRIASVGARGRLREDFGFVPRAAYFGGLTPAQSGFTNMYCYDPGATPFGIARGLPASRWGRAVEDLLGLRGFVDSEARRRLPAYAATYATSADIPLDLVANFDLAEKRAPWDPQVGYRSVFHEMDARGVPYFCCAWPASNALEDPSDAGIVLHTLAGVQPPCRFAFVHLQELDAIGHAFGPESAETSAAIVRADDRVETLMETLIGRFDAVDLVLFGDHGMVSVTRSVDVGARLAAAGLVPGADVMWFLDSTMARFWFGGRAVRARVIDALDGLPGRFLDQSTLEALHLDGCDRRNGELLFLLDPGTIIAPNFFQRSESTVRGMHGYHPDCPDNQGVLVVLTPDHPSPSADLGVVGATGIYREITRSLGFADCAAATPATVGGRSDPPRRFTQHEHSEADAVVALQLTRAAEAISAAMPDVSAVLVTGGFGRGEGALLADASGRLVPVNDYDLLAIAPGAGEPQSPAVQALGRSLAAEFGTDFVHISVSPALDPSMPLTLASYDLRHGSQVILGDPALLEQLPRWAAADIPTFEAVQLLLNRLAGLLTGLRPRHVPIDGRDGRYLRNQAVKALIAIGDAHLLRHGAYDVSYRRRRERLQWLGPGLGIEAEQQRAIDAAYAFKVYSDTARLGEVRTLAEHAARWAVAAVCDAIGEMSRRPIASAVEAVQAYDELTAAPAEITRADNVFVQRVLVETAAAGSARVVGHPRRSVRQVIYGAVLLVAAALEGDREAWAASMSRLADVLTGPWASSLTPEHWDTARSRLAGTWLAVVH